MNMNIVPIRQSQFNEHQVEIMRQTVAAGVPPAEFALFLEVCIHRGLNPLNREIYAIMRYDYQTNSNRMSIQVSIDGLRILAERSGKYLGQLAPEWCGPDGQWTDVWLSDDPPAAARVRILRSDFKQAITAVAKYSSYVQIKKDKTPTAMWAKMPDVMLAKCAESLALRKAFPETTAGLYTHEEMGQADNSLNSTVVDAPAPKSPGTSALVKMGIDAGLWDDIAEYRVFASDVLDRQLTQENAGTTSDERMRILTAIKEEIAKLHPAVIEAEVTQGDVSIDDLSRELQQQAAS